MASKELFDSLDAVQKKLSEEWSSLTEGQIKELKIECDRIFRVILQFNETQTYEKHEAE
jgi:hypothetical protein